MKAALAMGATPQEAKDVAFSIAYTPERQEAMAAADSLAYDLDGEAQYLVSRQDRTTAAAALSRRRDKQRSKELQRQALRQKEQEWLQQEQLKQERLKRKAPDLAARVASDKLTL